MSRISFALSLSAALAGAALLATPPASAGERHAFAVGAGTYFYGEYRGELRPLYYPRPHVHVLPGRKNGPQLYYGYHYDHIPAYPVPVFRSFHPPVVYHRTVVHPAGSAHVEWCYARYRSYRANDNSFQPYHGPRKQCWSPYS